MLKVAVAITIFVVVSARYYDYRDEDYNVPRRVLGLGGRWFRNLKVDTVNDMYNSRYYDPYYNDGYGYDPYNRYRGMSRLGYDGYHGGYDRHYGGDSYYPFPEPRRRRRY